MLPLHVWLPGFLFTCQVCCFDVVYEPLLRQSSFEGPYEIESADNTKFKHWVK